MAIAFNPNNAVRVFYFSLGVAAALAGYNEMRRVTWAGAREVATQWGTYQPSTTAAEERKELLLGPRARATMAREWNRLVDNTLGALATELGKRGI